MNTISKTRDLGSPFKGREVTNAFTHSTETPLVIDVWADEKSFRLYVPVNTEGTTEAACKWISKLNELGLRSRVPLVEETYAENVDFLRSCFAHDVSCPMPYLQETVHGEIGAVLFFVGDEIADGLHQLNSG